MRSEAMKGDEKLVEKKEGQIDQSMLMRLSVVLAARP